MFIAIEFGGLWDNARRQFVVENSSPIAMVVAVSSQDSTMIPTSIGFILWGIISESILVRIMIFIYAFILLGPDMALLWHNTRILIVLAIFGIISAGMCMITHDTVNLVLMYKTNWIGLQIYTLNAPLHIQTLTSAISCLASFITVSSATSLIVLKIVLVTRRSKMGRSYTKICEILIESAALVSIWYLGIAILQIASHVHPFVISTSFGRLLYRMYVYLDNSRGPITVCVWLTFTAYINTTW